MAPSRGQSTRLAALFAGLALALAGAVPVAAEDLAVCDRFDWSVRREQALFGALDLQTIHSGAAPVNLERGAVLELQTNASVAFVLPPARQPKAANSYGGVISADLPKAGTYQVTLSAEGWIDAIQNGKPVASAAHTGKRDCADVRKSVRFELQPGPVTIQISGAPAASIKIAVLPAE